MSPGPFQPLEEALVRQRSANIFNRIWSSRSDGSPASFFSLEIIDRDLRSHKLSDARFSRCRFEKTAFGPLTNVEFAGCTFISCKFNEADRKTQAALTNVLFYNCSFAETDFIDCSLVDVQFARTRFERPASFLRATFRGRIVIEKCGDWRSFIRLPDADFRLDWRNKLISDLNVERPSLVTWTAIRSLQQIPFLQTSLAGLVLLTAQLYLIEWLFRFLQLPAEECGLLRNGLKQLERPEITGLVSSLEIKLTEICAAIAPTEMMQMIFVSLSLSLLLFVSLFCASCVHKLAGPTEIVDYSATQWVIDQRRPLLFYQLIARRRRIWLGVCLILYAISSALFLFLFGSKIIAVVQRL